VRKFREQGGLFRPAGGEIHLCVEDCVSPDRITMLLARSIRIRPPYQTIITLEPGKRSGKPTIRGMQITIYAMFADLAAGMTYQKILEDFPYLTEEDIQACLSYAADRERQLLVAHA